MSIAKRLNALLGTNPAKDPFRRPPEAAPQPPPKPRRPEPPTLFDLDDTEPAPREETGRAHL